MDQERYNLAFKLTINFLMDRLHLTPDEGYTIVISLAGALAVMMEDENNVPDVIRKGKKDFEKACQIAIQKQKEINSRLN